MQISISDVLGMDWNLDDYRDALEAEGWVHYLEIDLRNSSLESLRNAITENDLWDTFHFLPHRNTAIPDKFEILTIRFKTEQDCLWAKMFF